MRKIRDFMGGLGNRLFQYGFLYSQVREGNLPDIYLQDYRYFHKYREELRQILGGGIALQPSHKCFISLHIRRGDYVNNPHYVDLTKTDYYQKAVAEMSKHFPKVIYMVYCADRQEGSDDQVDREWCKDFIRTLKIPFTMADYKNEIEDFNQMASSKGHIMANSSFSFWASYIGGGLTIAPKQWFTNGTTIPLPEEFILI